MSITKVASAPAINGAIDGGDPWSAITSTNITEARNVTTGLSGSFKMCYDNDFIYVLVDVTDPDPGEDGNSSWESDNVELFFAMDTANAASYREGDWQIRKRVSLAQLAGGIDGSNNVANSLLINPNFLTEQTTSTGSYILEWKLPWITLIGTSNFNGKNIRFDLQIAQNDGTGNQRNGQLFWNSNTDSQWASNRDFGYVTLTTPLTNYEPQVTLASTSGNVANTLGINTSFDITSTTDWTIDASPYWLNVDKTSGTGNSTVTLTTIEKNDMVAPREGYVVISWMQNGYKQTVNYKITQEGANVALNTSDNQVVVDKDGNGSLFISANTSLSISSSIAGVSQSHSGNNVTLTINIGANPNQFAERRAFIDIYAYDGNNYNFAKRIPIIQRSSAIKKAATAPTIDGVSNITEIWSTLTSNSLLMSLGDTSNFAANYKMCYDDNNIYVLVNVKDPNPDKVGVTNWQSDGVEFYFSMDTMRKNDNPTNIMHIIEQQSNGSLSGSSSVLNHANFNMVQTKTAGSYLQEWQIPIGSLTESGYFDGQNFLFEAQANQNDGTGNGRTGQLYWNSDADNQWQSTMNYASISLESPLPNLASTLQPSSRQEYMTSSQFARASLTLNTTSSWTISNTAEWLSLNNVSGTGTTQINLTARTANPSGYRRNAVLTINWTDINGSHSTDVLITQEGSTPYMNLSETKFDFTNTNSANLTISSNINYTVSKANSDWFTINNSGSISGNSTISINTGNVESYGKATGKIFVNWTDNLGNAFTETVILTKPGRKVKKIATAPNMTDNAIDAIWNSLPANHQLQAKNDTTNFASLYKMAYDNDNLYILIDVKDQNPGEVGSTTWQSDCVELFFGMDTLSTNNHPDGAWQFRKVASKSQADGGVDGSGPVAAMLMNNPNFLVEQTMSANGYIQEWQLPWESIVDTSYFNGKDFRFDIQTAQNDGTGYERTGQLFWNSNADDQWNTTRNMGYLTLETPLSSYEPALTVSTRKLTMGSLTSNAVSFTINSSVVWNIQTIGYFLNVDKTSGTGNATVTLTSQNDNQSQYSRSENITLVWQQGGKTTSLIIEVNQIGSFKMVLPDTVIIPYNGPVNFDIKSNLYWSISKESVSWFTLNYNGSYNGNATVQAFPPFSNLSFKSRQSFATVQWLNEQGNTEQKKIIIIQQGTTIKKIATALNIDGQDTGNEWAGLTSVYPNQIGQIKGDTTGFSANYKMCYDDNNLYILVDVKDPNTSKDGSTSWQSDCVELFLSMDTLSASSYRGSDLQVRKVASKTKVDGGVDGSTNVDILLNDANFNVMQTLTTNVGYTQEWQIPLSALTQAAYFDGSNFRFEMQVSQNDGTGNERTGQLFWNSNADDQWAKTYNLGYLAFESPITALMPALTVSNRDIKLSNTAGTNSSFNIKSTNSWTIDSYPAWIKLDKTSGTGNATVTINVEANNPKAYTREGFIEISWTQNSVVHNINVKITQDPAVAFLNVINEIVYLDENNQGSIVFETNASNGSYNNGSIPLTYSLVNTGINENTLNITAQVNDLLSAKSDTMTIFWYDENNSMHEKKALIVQNPTKLKKVATAPTIDGNAGASEIWNSIAANPMVKFNGDTTNFSANYKMCYDDDYIYVLATVNDLNPAQAGGSTWQSDNVDLYFSMDTFNSPQYTDGDWQIRKVAHKTLAQGGIDGSSNVSDVLLNCSRFSVEQVTNPYSYIQEWKIPIDTLIQGSFFDGSHIRFDIQADQNIGGTDRIGSLFWNSNADDQYSQIKNQGYITFETPITPNIPALTISKGTLILNGIAPDSITITSTVNYRLYTNFTWLNNNTFYGFPGTTKHFISAPDLNPLKEKQVGHYWVEWEESGKTKTQSIFVTQLADPNPAYLSLYINEKILISSESSFSFNVNSNINWEVSTNCNWLKFDIAGSGKGSKFITVTATDLNPEEAKTASIYFDWFDDNGVLQTSELVVRRAGTTEINKVISAPIVDGSVTGADPWALQTAHNLDKPRGIVDNFSASYKMCYDNSNLYILVDVTDPNPAKDGASSWQSDCIELFMAMNTENSDQYRDGDWQMRKVASKTQAQGGVDGSYLYDILSNPDFKVNQTTSATGYVQEWQIPFNELAKYGSFDGENFRFDMQASQNDGTGNQRTGQLFWFSNADDQWTAIRNQGLIKLKEPIAPITQVLTTNKQAIGVDYALAAQSDEISIASSVSWTATPADSWFTISPSSGTGNATVKAVISQGNTSIDSRSSYFTLTWSQAGIEKTKKIYVTQNGAPIQLSINPSVINANAQSSITKLDITINTIWQPTSFDSWISFDNTDETNGNGSVNVILTPNTTMAPRSGLVYINYKQGNNWYSDVVSVNQDFSSLVTSTNTLSMPPVINGKTFNVSSTEDWTITSSQSWLTILEESGTGDLTINVHATANLAFSPRTATITVSNGKGINRIIEVTQAATSPILSVAPANIGLTNINNATGVIDVTSNVDWTATSNQTWLTLSKSGATGNSTIVVSASENTGFATRTAVVTVRYNASISAEVTITQSGAAATLTTAITQLNLKSAANSKDSFNVTSNIKWNASVNKSWLTLNKTTDSASSKLVAIPLANLSVVPRNAIISITGNGVATRSITVNQAGADSLLTVDSTNLNIKSLANSMGVFNTKSNIPFTLVSNSNWLTLSTLSDSGVVKITATATANTSLTARKAIVSITGGKITRNITISQVGVDTIFNVSPLSVSINDSANSASLITVTSNIDWSVTSDNTWLTLSKATGNGNSTFSAIAKANPTVVDRIANITITGGKRKITVKVTQKGCPIILSTDLKSITISAAANSKSDIKVTSNISWTLSSDKDWLTISSKADSGNVSISVIAAENTTTVKRTATVTLSSKYLPDIKISVEQAAGTSSIATIANNSIDVYPNPVVEKLYINFADVSTVQNIVVLSINGQQLIKVNEISSESTIDVNRLKSGIYNVRINLKDGKFVTRKFIKK